MIYDALILDLDGTLWDASSTTAKAWNEGLKNLAIPQQISTEEVKKVTGRPQKECIDLLLPNPAQNIRGLYETLSKLEYEHLKTEGGEIYPNVPETLIEFASKIPLFIVSNCEQWYLDLFLKKSGTKKHFKETVCFGSSGKAKSEMLKDLKNKHQLKSPLYVGDTEGDKKAAEEAGMDFVFATYGFGSLEHHKRIQKFTELKNLLR